MNCNPYLFFYSPRMRGGQPCLFSLPCRSAVFSPHARGPTLPDCNIPQQNAILPACAGVNPVPRLRWRVIQDSPRMRGGQPEEGVRTTKRDGILPACAGVNPSTSFKTYIRKDSPRMRGGQPSRNRIAGSEAHSPRMRGGQPRTPSPFEGDIGFSPHARGSP